MFKQNTKKMYLDIWLWKELKKSISLEKDL